MIDTGLQTLLLQNLLDLKTEFNQKADVLISLLGTSRSETFVSTPHQTAPNAFTSHLDSGVRWDAEDYSYPIEANVSAIPQLFKDKIDESKAMGQSFKSSTPMFESSEFEAFRQKKGTLHDLVGLNESFLDSVSVASYTPSNHGFSTFRAKSNSQRRKMEAVNFDDIESGSPLSKKEKSSFALSMFQSMPRKNKSPHLAKSVYFEEKDSMLKSPSSEFQRGVLRQKSMRHQPKAGNFANLKRGNTSPALDSSKIIKSFQEKSSPFSDDNSESQVKPIPVNEESPPSSEPQQHELVIPTASIDSSGFAGVIYDLFAYLALIPAFDSKGLRVSVDQFNQSDFEGMCFYVNGIHPKSHLTTILDLILIGLYFSCLLIVPLLIGFVHNISAEITAGFSITISIIYVLDSLITLSTPQSALVNTNIYSIREYELMRPFLAQWLWQWMKIQLLPDVLSTIPFDLIFSIEPHYTRFFLLLRLIRVFRLPYLVHRCAFFTRIRKWMEAKWGAGITKIVPITVGIVVFIHYNACMIYYAAESHGFFGWDLIWLRRANASFWESYIWAFVLGVGNMFPMAFKPQTIIEQFMAILFIFIGAGLYAILVGYISSAAMSIDSSGRAYNQKMEELVDYIKWRKFSEETRQKLVQYYETKYRGKYFEEDGLLSDMNESLRMEVSLQNTRDLIVKVPFLRREGNDYRNEIFYSRVASALHVRYFIPGDCVIKQGELGSDMFFILSGKCDVLVDGDVKVSLYDGAYFGEVAMITKTLRTATVKATMPSVLYRLTEHDFHQVIAEFPDIQLRIAELASEREKLLALNEETRLKKREAIRE
ncbi:hypothetical protein BDR26DRAFT_871263, partial [Obelidium mucronatum]